MKRILLAVLAVLTLVLTALFAVPAYAQAPSSSSTPKCEGPAALCAQVLELQQKVEAQKAVADKAAGEKTAEAKALDKKRSDDTAKMVAFAATLAILLKTLLSALKGWKDYFKTDKGKAWLKIISVVVGFAAFILTNIGFGIPWWQALIVAGGGPGSILVHELMKLVPVIRGKKPSPADEKDSEPPAKPEEPKPEEPKPEEPKPPAV